MSKNSELKNTELTNTELTNTELKDTELQTWELISAERLRLADELEGLTDEQWATQSQCDYWTVREVAAHLVTPFETSMPKFMLNMALSRFDFDKAIRRMTAGVNDANSTAEIIAKLRANHDNRWTPPQVGAEIPLSEIVVHGQDIRRVLGLANTVPESTIEHTLAGIEDLDQRADYAQRIGASVHTG